MIFYFSATGNCKYVASRIASETKEAMISITECIKNRQLTFEIDHEERIGIITPVYWGGLPVIVNDFLSELKLLISDSHALYIYYIATYGTITGQTGCIVKQYLQEKRLPLNGRFSIRMPDTWTPIYDLSDKKEIEETNKEAEKQIDEVIQSIKSKSNGDFSQNKLPLLLVKIYYSLYENKYRKTKNFRVEDSCINCKLCSKKCPVGAIEMKDKKPSWVKSKCVLCLACLHHCPTFSIQYGKNTKKHGQYVNPNVKS